MTPTQRPGPTQQLEEALAEIRRLRDREKGRAEELDALRSDVTSLKAGRDLDARVASTNLDAMAAKATAEAERADAAEEHVADLKALVLRLRSALAAVLDSEAEL